MHAIANFEMIYAKSLFLIFTPHNLDLLRQKYKSGTPVSGPISILSGQESWVRGGATARSNPW